MSKKILVIGAGLAGMLSAYYLSESGHEVTVIDSANDCGDGASHANGGQLSYMYADPFGSPATFMNLPHYIFSRGDKAVFLSMKPEIALWDWYARLLLNCLPWLYKKNAENVLRLNLLSRNAFEEFQRQEKIDFDFSSNGKLHLYYDKKSFATAMLEARKMDSADHPQIMLTPEQCAEKEPAISHLGPQLAGGIFSAIDSAGDALKFIYGLKKLLEERSNAVKFVFNKPIDGFATYDDKILSAMSGTDGFTADEFVMAAGCHSRHLLALLGINAPIYPVKGYSITAPIIDFNRVNKASITDHSKRLVFTHLGNKMRVAGFAEFAGYDRSINLKRIELLQRWTEEVLPGAVDIKKAESWAGLRPGMPNTVPMIGRSNKIRNLHLNTGHGMLGWTMAHGTAKLVSDSV